MESQGGPAHSDYIEMMTNASQEFIEKHGLEPWRTWAQRGGRPEQPSWIGTVRPKPVDTTLMALAWGEYYEPTIFKNIACVLKMEGGVGFQVMKHRESYPYLMMIGKLKEHIQKRFEFSDMKYFKVFVGNEELTDNCMNLNKIQKHNALTLDIKINTEPHHHVNPPKQSKPQVAEAPSPAPAPVPSVIHAELVNSVRNGDGITAQRTSDLEEKVETLEQKVKDLEKLVEWCGETFMSSLYTKSTPHTPRPVAAPLASRADLAWQEITKNIINSH